MNFERSIYSCTHLSFQEKLSHVSFDNGDKKYFRFLMQNVKENIIIPACSIVRDTWRPSSMLNKSLPNCEVIANFH